jgi:hypothetical protein
MYKNKITGWHSSTSKPSTRLKDGVQATTTSQRTQQPSTNPTPTTPPFLIDHRWGSSTIILPLRRPIPLRWSIPLWRTIVSSLLTTEPSVHASVLLLLLILVVGHLWRWGLEAGVVVVVVLVGIGVFGGGRIRGWWVLFRHCDCFSVRGARYKLSICRCGG